MLRTSHHCVFERKALSMQKDKELKAQLFLRLKLPLSRALLIAKDKSIDPFGASINFNLKHKPSLPYVTTAKSSVPFQFNQGKELVHFVDTQKVVFRLAQQVLERDSNLQNLSSTTPPLFDTLALRQNFA